MKLFTRAFVFCFFLCSCRPSVAQTIHTFLPSQADSLITSNNTLDYAGIDTVPLLNKLFLFLPGTGAGPGGYQDVLRTAGQVGYHVLGLSYVNNNTIGSLCTGYGDTCQGQARTEDFYGGNFSAVLTVDSADAIRTRILDALKYLNTNYPTEGWGQYLYSPDSILWNKVCISGHSQGAGMASIIAYWFSVDRAVFFATGGDPSAPGNVAAWMDSTSATPASRKYAFDHRQDELFWGTNNATPVIWDTLGLCTYGNYISVDTLSGNFYGRHCFTSNLVITSADSLVYHDCVATDGTTPLTGSVPTYQPVWIYMMTDTGAITDTTASGVATTPAMQTGYEIYPNPASDMISIDAHTPPATEAITVSDMTGRVLIEKVIPGAYHIALMVNMLAPGIYTARVNDEVRKICIR